MHLRQDGAMWLSNGIPDDIKVRRPRDWHKEFKWHAIRFSNKVYAVFDAFQNADTDWVVWVDADTFVHNIFLRSMG